MLPLLEAARKCHIDETVENSRASSNQSGAQSGKVPGTLSAATKRLNKFSALRLLLLGKWRQFA